MGLQIFLLKNDRGKFVKSPAMRWQIVLIVLQFDMLVHYESVEAARYG